MHKNTISLGGRWKLKYEGDWLDAEVPGEVRLDLLRSNLIPDPFYSDNNESMQWISEREWLYKKEFSVPLDGRWRLRFEGVDYISEFWLNDVKLGEHTGMFSAVTFDVTGLLKENNTLLVKLAPPPQTRREVVKCQMGYGWDFAPRIVTMGIWDDVYLIRSGDLYIDSIFVIPELDGKDALVKIRAEVVSKSEARDASFNISIKGKNFPYETAKTFKVNTKSGTNFLDFEVPVENAKLWMPWDRGEQNLYEITVSSDGSDAVTDTFGIRKFERVMTDGALETHEPWVFVLNSVREFIRGANWVPADSIFARVDRAKYSKLIKMAKEANMNMFRLWGGGLREKKEFYDLCDEEGILIWQEFPFACAIGWHYPQDENYIRIARHEAEGIVRSIRNHPSLVLWCGGNEYSYKNNSALVDTLVKVCKELDGTRPFHLTSPRNGDTHNWTIWHFFAPYKSYKEDDSPFMSEFGFQSMPGVDTLKAFVPEMRSPKKMCRYHNRDWGPRLKFLRYTWYSFRPAKNIESFVEATQKAQAYALKTAIEHFRRRKYKCGGCMIWQLNDPWPSTSWSTIDYYLRPKLAYEYVKRVYNPVLVSLDYKIKRYKTHFEADVWVINDLSKKLEDCTVDVSLVGTDVRFTERVSIPADSSQKIGRLGWEFEKVKSPRVNARIVQGGRVISENEYDIGYSDLMKWYPEKLILSILHRALSGEKKE
jgi:beta-mannosidase